MNEKYFIVAKDKASLLERMMEALQGNAHISFEGNLSKCDFSKIPGASSQETEVLKKITFFPVQDFIVLPLEKEIIRLILYQVLPNNRFSRDIIHIQIEKNNSLDFGSYDNFHPDCIACSETISAEFLQSLVTEGTLKSFDPVETPDKSKE